MRTEDVSDLRSLFLGATPIIDVRAPVEFAQGSLPGSVNLPILDDEERARVGTVYKERGNEAAVALGHELVSGSVKEGRVRAWLDFLARHPSAVFCCFRGGQRSQISRRWAAEAGAARPLVLGGYKAARHFLSDELTRIVDTIDFLAISGPTGAGKSVLLSELRVPALDLEGLAKHRGSAFGAVGEIQPPQATFENQLGSLLMRIEEDARAAGRLVVEDESRLIGRCSLPPVLFARVSSAPVIWVDEPLEARVEHIFSTYVQEGFRRKGPAIFADFAASLDSIQRKLGGALHAELRAEVEAAGGEARTGASLEGNRGWIEKLLRHYYDPLYLYGIEKRKPPVLFRGTRRECLAFLSGGGPSGSSR